MNVLVVGFTTEKGRKVSDFLHSRGMFVYGLDRNIEGDYRSLTRRFSLNPRHKESVRLMFEIAKPSALVYCVVESENRENYIPFLTILTTGIGLGVSKVVLVINENFPISEIETLSQVETLAMTLVLKVLGKTEKYEYVVINEKDNLLKEVKRFLLKEEGKIL